ncbi:hypothetical protein [Brevundimonas subvibrioides]|uniref:hypothetical protein n=1 Tax=Brevundimonas subvibrioides TaxID=74313 RepID=UPI0022B40F74|nr:hypothetical protein [Brevundimonas subvibrioides]
MTAFAIDPVFTLLQRIALAGFLLTAGLIRFGFSPKRRAIMGNPKLALATAGIATPVFAGVTMSSLSRDHANVGKAVWSARVKCWMGRA